MDTFEIGEDEPVAGMSWLENKIYVIHEGSTSIHVYPDNPPYKELKDEEIKIKKKKKWRSRALEVKSPRDMVASQVSCFLFISDANEDSGCIWKVKMPGRRISRLMIDGIPSKLSISTADELMAIVSRENRLSLDVYTSTDFIRTKTVLLPAEVVLTSNVVQTTNGNFIVSYEVMNSKSRMISEMSSDGKNFIRTVEYLTLFEVQLKNCHPRYLAIDEKDRIFVADYRDNAVLQYNSQLTNYIILLDDDKQRINLPQRLCYVRNKQQLIVVHGWSPTYVSIFHLGT